jgi:DNA helicase II / ATP-dependent DNA helicase PcrA
MTSIHCGNCGQLHQSVTEVRACHRDRPPSSDAPEEFGEPIEPDVWAPPGDERPKFAARRSDPVASPARTTVAALTGISAGPDVLGRSIVVRPGAPVPEAWSHAPRIAIDGASPATDALVELHVAWLERSRVVVELWGDIPAPEAGPDVPIWDLSPGIDLPLERLAFLLTANCIDGRDGNERWWALDRAVQLGATDGGAADVVLPDGTEAWLDGGPMGLASSAGVSLVPTVHLDHGSLAIAGPDNPDAELAADQLEAVEHRHGAARIVAPAGSGKTRVLTERARHLLRERHHPPSALTLVAFNRRAQQEMTERTSDLTNLRVSTLNALGLAIVAGRAPFIGSNVVPGPVEVIDERQVRRILDDLVSVRRRANTDPIAAWIEALTAVRLGLRPPNEVERSFGGDVDGLSELVAKYRATLRQRRLVDFDEQIVSAIEVLLADPAARAAAQLACRTMLVDEFQDLTPAHLLMVRLLAGPGADVFGVGDDDQTIYGFTGASPRWLIDFERWFPGASSHSLDINYRCPPGVIDAATNLLTHNRERVHKTISAAPDRSASGRDLDIIVTDDPLAAISAECTAAVAHHRPEDVIVLTRVNSSLAPVQVALRAAGHPVVKAVDGRFLERSGVRAVLAWLRLAQAQRFDPADLAIAARRPTRGLSARVVEWIAEQRGPQELRRLADRMRERDAERIAEFADDLEVLRSASQRRSTTTELLTILRDDIGLARALDQLDSSRRAVDRSAHGDDLDALLSLAHLQPDPTRFEPWLRAELDAPGDPAGIQLSTVHRVKGREWAEVIVASTDEGLFPHRLADDIEEERRVFHVAITRAEHRCVVVGDARRPSRFIAEMGQAKKPGSVVVSDGARRSRTSVVAPPTPTAESGGLRDRLREWRRDRAQSDGVPAYVVFNDRTLDELVAVVPTSQASLRRIHGIGAAKIERYGDDLLAVLNAP